MITPLIGTGISGLVGSRIVELLSDSFVFESLSLSEGVDITNRTQIDKLIKKNPANTILHMAAFADVDGCEKDKVNGTDGVAWKVNVLGTRNIVETAALYGKRVLFISTDFVFDGKKDEYSEIDIPNPINWYGMTKYEGEKMVLDGNSKNLVLRISYPYRATNDTKVDFFHALLNRLQKNEEVYALTDHIFTPTFIDDIASVIAVLVNSDHSGIFHSVGNSSLTPYSAAEEIAAVFGLDKTLIHSTTREDFYRNRASRPYKLKLNNDKIKHLGISMKTFTQGLTEIQKQLSL